MSSYTAAKSGVQGNTQDFSGLRSGKGGNGSNGDIGGAGASGGGASGGGGAYGGGNEEYFSSGGGGGGAGGSSNAGGGAGGGSYFPGTSASNHKTTSVSGQNYLGQPSNLGRGGNGQTSSQAATNGYNGWFYILKFQDATPLNLGNITEVADNTIDCGLITDNVNSLLEMGQIA